MLQKNFQQLGLELKREREARNIKLEDIARQLRINLDYLKSIERGDFSFLPDPYRRYFLKLYLQFLGGSADRYLRIYDELQYPAPPTSDATIEKPVITPTMDWWSFIAKQIKNFKYHNQLLMIIGAFTMMLVIISLIVKKDDINDLADSNAPGKSFSKQDSQLASFSSLIPLKKKLNLNMVAQERTWMQIAIDDSAAHEYIFEKGDTNTWQANEKFLIRLGNGAGIRLYLNGNDLGQLGDRMETVNVLLTKDGIQQKKL